MPMQGSFPHAPKTPDPPSAVGDRARLTHAAYEQGNASLSRLAHDLASAPEHHQSGGGYLKAAVFGALDGIITVRSSLILLCIQTTPPPFQSFAVVASVYGASLKPGVVIVLGFANVLANGISMGIGEYLGGRSEVMYAQTERKREEWEFDNYPDGEVQEMVELYQEKGYSEEDAKAAMQLMIRNREFFINHMMVQELGLMPPDEDESPFKQGIVMFISFVIFGIVPLFREFGGGVGLVKTV